MGLEPQNRYYHALLVVTVTPPIWVTLVIPCVSGEEDTPTPLVGEEFHAEVLGERVKVPAHDRKNVTAASFGMEYLPVVRRLVPVAQLG